MGQISLIMCMLMYTSSWT